VTPAVQHFPILLAYFGNITVLHIETKWFRSEPRHFSAFNLKALDLARYKSLCDYEQPASTKKPVKDNFTAIQQFVP